MTCFRVLSCGQTLALCLRAFPLIISFVICFFVVSMFSFILVLLYDDYIALTTLKRRDENLIWFFLI